MPPRIDDPARRQSDFLTLRLQPGVAEQLRRHAAARGWTMSVYVREAVMAAIEVEERVSR